MVELRDGEHILEGRRKGRLRPDLEHSERLGLTEEDLVAYALVLGRDAE